MTSHDQQSSHQRNGFSGPRCWALSALVGLLLGIGFAWIAPAGSTSHAGHAAEHDLPRVRETLSGGTQLERLPDGATQAWSDNLSRAAQAAGSNVGPPETNQTVHPSPPSLPPTDASSTSSNHQPAQDPHAAPAVPLWLCAPFALLLGSIAIMPFINAKFWTSHFPDFAFGLGAFIAGYYLAAFGGYGRHAILHALIEYYSFIALVGGLFVVSGGIMIDVRAKATPLANTALLAFGAVLANLVGTTGASMLLIRPFMRMNTGRLRPIHIVLFIFIVSNCGGCLTPIGDPPLYLGYLKGVPFTWTLTHLWPMWLVCVGALLTIFFVIDTRIARHAEPRSTDKNSSTDLHPATPLPDAADDAMHAIRTIRLGPLALQGLPALGLLVLMVLGVFIDPLLTKYAGIEGLPIGATFQLVVAITAYLTASKRIHRINSFNFHPVEEVGFLFVGIFLTMVPALGYLAANASKLGLESPTQYYFFSGGLSAVLDNAPTYLNFLQSGLGILHLPMDPAGINRFITSTYDVVHHDGVTVHFHGQVLLEAISLGAVFFGAMTYIGNGPNFMVKSIAEAQAVRMPSFFAYLGLSCAILLPVLILVWAIFVR